MVSEIAALWSHHHLLPAVLAGAVLVLLLRTISTYLSRRTFKLRHGCRPIRNRFRHRDPLLGIDFLFFQFRTAAAGKILEYQHERSLKYGPTFDMYLLKDRFINTTDPENIKTVLALHFKDYGLGLRKSSMHHLLGDGIFCSDGERWHASRNLIRPNFVREQVADIDAFERHFQVLLSLIPRDGDTVDLQDLFFRLTIDTATEFLFGQSVRSLEAAKEGRGSDSEFAEAFNYAQKDALARFRLRQLSFLHRDSKADWAVKFVHNFVDGIVDQKLRQRQAQDPEKTDGDSPAKYVFLHELAKATTDRKVLRDELLNVLLAGRDTTASLLSNFFFVLAKRPDVWTKLRTEVAKLNGMFLPRGSVFSSDIST